MALTNKSVIFDSSALLALLQEEPGYKIAEEHLTTFIMSAINVSESIAGLIKIGIPPNEAKITILDIVKNIVPFCAEQACIAAQFIPFTKSLGLSLGDRACLALGKQLNLTVLTTDKVWKKPNLGIHIQLLR